MDLVITDIREDEDERIVKSTRRHKRMEDGLLMPDVSLPEFLLKSLKMNEKAHGDKTVAIDANTGRRIFFKELEPLSRNFSSALNRLGFQKGDVLYYVTYNASLLFVLYLGVWRSGGSVRGCYQKEFQDEIARQMRQTKCRFVLCDPETAPVVKSALEQVEWTVRLLSVDGEVEGAIQVEDMVHKDDGSAFTDDIYISPKEDVACIVNTNGTTGFPKGALHTHHNMVAFLVAVGAPKDLQKHNVSIVALSLVGNYTIGNFISFCTSVVIGNTYITITKFEKKDIFKHIERYRPVKITVFPSFANWFARCSELDSHDVSSLKTLTIGGSVLDSGTLSIIRKRLPEVIISMCYGMTEALIITTAADVSDNPHKSLDLKMEMLNGCNHISCGPLLPCVEAKITDFNTGKILGRKSKGKLHVRAPWIMKGYVKGSDTKGDSAVVDADGWLETGDIAFFDDEGQLYIVDRCKAIFKYLMYHVSPSDVERVIGEHPSVLSVGVVGVPHPDITTAATAYVVKKPGHDVTENDIKNHVAAKTPVYKHLHGGVVFVNDLPMTRGGKLDHKTILEWATAYSNIRED